MSGTNSDYVDKSTLAKKSINVEHDEIHKGHHFYIVGFQTVANNGTLDFVVETPGSSRHAHMTFQIEGSSQTELLIYRAITASENGTVIPPINNDENSSNISILTVRKDPTVSDLTTLIYSQSKGKAGETPSRADQVGIIIREKEIILKASTKYLFRIISREDGNIISYYGSWYEHRREDH